MPPSLPPSRARHGQVTAPIELFVAVIIMTMSIGLSLYLWSTFQDIQCGYTLKAQNQRLQEAFQEVVAGSSETTKTVEYKLERCGSRPVEAVRFVHFDNPKYCGRCPGNYGGCWIIESLVYDAQNELLLPLTDSSVCVELSESLALNPIQPSSGSSTCNVDLSTSPCPIELGGRAVSATECARIARLPAAVWAPGSAGTATSQYTTFSRESGSTSLFYRVKVTKRATAATGTGTGGQLDICVFQQR